MSIPLILITNDDGIKSPGLRKLISIANSIGKVVVVAPDGPRSAQSNAITLEQPIRCDRVTIDKGRQIEYSCSGTPVDCVKLALNKILDRKPDICLSGINHGSNASINVIYSGTVSAAMEASINKIPSLAFSILDYSLDADFTESELFIKKIILKSLENKIPNNTCLNINIPKSIKSNKIKGIKVCHQASSKWVEQFNERFDPRGNRYFWLSGDFIIDDKTETSDEYFLKNQFISIVPVQYDLTSYESIDYVNSIFNNE